MKFVLLLQDEEVKEIGEHILNMSEQLMLEMQDQYFALCEKAKNAPKSKNSSPNKDLLMHQLKRTVDNKDYEMAQVKKTHDQIFGQFKRQIDEL